MGGFNYRADPQTDKERLRYSVSALLASRGVKEFDGPAAAVFWAGGNDGAWAEYVAYANGAIQPRGAPRMLDRTLDSIGKLVDNAVRTFAALLDNRHALGEPMPCAAVWRVRPELVPEDDGRISWRARCAFVPLCDVERGMSVDRPEPGEASLHTAPATTRSVEDLCGAGWTASVEVSRQDNGHVHVRAYVRGMDEITALAGAKAVLDRAKGKEALIRIAPEVRTETDFATNERLHKGYVRFIYRDQPGEWTYPEPQPQPDMRSEMRYLPLPGLQQVAGPQPPVTGKYPPIKEESARWPSPTLAMLRDPLFNAIWDAIKAWDINVPHAYSGYCGATGNHARRIYEAVMAQLLVDLVDRDGEIRPTGKEIVARFGRAMRETDAAPVASVGVQIANPARDRLLEVYALFAAATVEDMQPQCDLNVSSLDRAKSIIREPGILLAAESLRDVVFAIHSSEDGLGCDFSLIPTAVLGSPHAWALLSKDGKRAVVGMR